MRETTTINRITPDLQVMLRRLNGWAQSPETCQGCKRAKASVLQGVQGSPRPLCARCAGSLDPTRQAAARAAALLGAIEADDRRAGAARRLTTSADAPPDGYLGIAFRFNEPVQVRPGHWEQFARGAFGRTLSEGLRVAVNWNHGRSAVGMARVYSCPAGAAFDIPTLDDTPGDAAGVVGASVEFSRDDCVIRSTAYQGGVLETIEQCAGLTGLALLTGSRRPVYRTWAARRDAAGWRRLHSESRDVLFA